MTITSATDKQAAAQWKHKGIMATEKYLEEDNINL